MQISINFQSNLRYKTCSVDVIIPQKSIAYLYGFLIKTVFCDKIDKTEMNFCEIFLDKTTKLRV